MTHDSQHGNYNMTPNINLCSKDTGVGHDMDTRHSKIQKKDTWT